MVERTRIGGTRVLFQRIMLYRNACICRRATSFTMLLRAVDRCCLLRAVDRCCLLAIWLIYNVIYVVPFSFTAITSVSHHNLLCPTDDQTCLISCLISHRKCWMYNSRITSFAATRTSASAASCVAAAVQAAAFSWNATAELFSICCDAPKDP